ncbi:MAG: hypothetical protein ABI616_11600 [Pseudomonadota bacterium]
MSDSGYALLRIAEHQNGEFLRLQTSGAYAMEAALEALGFIETELEAEIEDTGWKRGLGLKVSEPVLIQLEGLNVELSTDGTELLLRRVAGSTHEFEELCELIASHYRWE